MRARNIKPGFYRDADLAECSIAARYLCPGLWMMADREGRLKDHPKQIKMDLCPCDDLDVDALLDELADARHIMRYTTHDGQRLIQIRNFSTHQNPHRNEPKSVLPCIDESVQIAASSNPADNAGMCSGKTCKGVTCQEPSRNVATCPERSSNGASNPADSLIPDSLIPEKKKLSASKLPDAVEFGLPLTAIAVEEKPAAVESTAKATAAATAKTTATANVTAIDVVTTTPQSQTFNAGVEDNATETVPVAAAISETAKVSAADQASGNGNAYITKRKRKLNGWKLEAFNEFWGAFGLKKGKAEAADAWLDIPNLNRRTVEDCILPAARKEARLRTNLIAQGKTPKWAQGWLAGRRWEDEAYWSDEAAEINWDEVPML